MSVVIALSGIDGSGKSTCANMLKDILESKGYSVKILDSMKEGPFTEALKRIATENGKDLRASFSANIINLSWSFDLIYNYEEKIKGYLNQGFAVILHRSDLCCRVYSSLFCDGNNIIDKILNEFNFEYTLHIHLNIDPRIAFKRIKRRTKGAQMKKKEELDMLISADLIYQKYLSCEKYKNVLRVDGDVKKKYLYNDMYNVICNNILERNK